MIDIPPAFAERIRTHEGAAGERWLAELDFRVTALGDRWGLAIDGPPRHGHLALVIPVLRNAEQCALKVAWPDSSSQHERLALACWKGHGAVRLLDAAPEHGALLLERLDPDRTLASLPVDEALAVAGRLIRALAIPAPAVIPSVAEEARRIATGLSVRWERLGRPFSRELLEAALSVAANANDAAGMMVNWDLHDENVLAGTREPWLAIDPKVVRGAPEYGVAQFLWRRIDELSGPAELARCLRLLIDTAGLDEDLTRAWTLIRVVDYWLWALSIGLTEDPRRCATLLDWLDR